MLISIDDYMYEFRMFSLGLESSYEMYDRRNDQTSGVFKITEMLEITDQVITTESHVSLWSEDKSIEVELGKPSSITLGNLISMTFECDNIFDTHRDIMNILNHDHKYPDIQFHFLRCFNLPRICNLKCPYCSQGNYNPHKNYTFDYFLASNIISLEQTISKNILHDSYYTDRYMGGETFLSWSEFDRTVNFYHNKFKDGDMLRIYTNNTIPNYIEKFSDMVSSNNYEVYDMWISIDTLDHKTSLRLATKLNEDIFISNLIKLKNTLLPKDNVIINFNIMYNGSPRDFMNVVKTLHSMGFKNYKFGFDESISSIDNYMRKHTVGPRLIKLANRYLNPTKMKINDTLIYKFNVLSFGEELYSNKISVVTNRNHIELFESMNDVVDNIPDRKLRRVEL